MQDRPGAAPAQIATALGWSQASVRSRLTEIRARLGAGTGDDLLALARDRGCLHTQPRAEQLPLEDRPDAPAYRVRTVSPLEPGGVPDWSHTDGA